MSFFYGTDPQWHLMLMDFIHPGRSIIGGVQIGLHHPEVIQVNGDGGGFAIGDNRPGQFFGAEVGGNLDDHHAPLPAGLEMQVRPRSGLALRHGVTLPNAPGTIDADYRGELKVIVQNGGSEPVTLPRGDRIAQLVFARFETPSLEEVGTLGATERGAGGFGSTGV